MNAFERYAVLMGRQDTDPSHWRALWLSDTSARLEYLSKPLLKVSSDLVRAVARLDAAKLTLFLMCLSEQVNLVTSEYLDYPFGGEAAALRAMVKLAAFPSVKQAMPAIAIAGLATALIDDLYEATTVYCAGCGNRMEKINLTPEVLVLLCPDCDGDDPRWFQDTRCTGQDLRGWIQAALSCAIGYDAGQSA